MDVCSVRERLAEIEEAAGAPVFWPKEKTNQRMVLFYRKRGLSS
jgi:hypothetical protein